MPSTSDPQHGIQAVTARIQAIVTRLTNLEVWQRQSSAIISAGVITQWPGATAPPGALVCNGASFDGTAYPQLAAALGSTTLPTISTSPMTVIWTGPQSSI